MNKHYSKYVERLEQLVRVMRGLSRHERTQHFNMKDWGEETECGTTMCAAGFAGSDPWFRRRGFILVEGWSGSRHPRFRGLKNWQAISEFFGTLPGDGAHRWGGNEDICRLHPVFARPKSVGDVIKAAKARIKQLKELP